MCNVPVPCMHHDAAICPGSSLGRQPVPRSKPLPIMCCDYRPRNHKHKDTLLTDVNLITMRLGIAANRRVVNRFPYSTTRIECITSRCASPRHARDLSSIFDGFTDLVKTFNQDQHSFIIRSYTHFPQLLVLERKKKLKLGLKLGKELKRISQTNMAILVWDSFQFFSQLAPATRPLRLLTNLQN